jgi:hypothetical protein
MADPARRRGPYQVYDLDPELVDAVFAQFVDNPPWGFFARLEREYGYPSTTIGTWFRLWKDKPDWRPHAPEKKMNHRVFTDPQEEAIMQKLDEKFFQSEKHVSGRTLQVFSQQFWVQHRKDAHLTDTFAASSRFRARFMRDHGFSLRKATISKPKGEDDAEIAQFLADIERVARQYGPDRCLNMDETAWWHVQARARTLAPKGAECVSVSVNGNPKGKTSVICTVSMCGDKYPPIYLVKGKIPKMRESLEPSVPSDRVTLSDSGWMEQENMLRYLSWLKVAVYDQPMALIMDGYSNHVTPIVKDKAESLEIEIIPVPSGRTGQFQPLDRTVFGPLKSMSAKVWDERYAANPDTQWTPEQAASIMEECWPRLKRSTIVKGWQFEEDSEEEAESESSEVTDSPYHCREYSDEEDPSSGTFAHQREIVQSARQRQVDAKRDEIIAVECHFDDLPAADDELFPVRTHRIQAEIDAQDRCAESKRKRTVKLVTERHETSFAFPQETHRHPHDQEPIFDSDGFIYPQPQYRPRDQCFD